MNVDGWRVCATSSAAYRPGDGWDEEREAEEVMAALTNHIAAGYHMTLTMTSHWL